MSTLLYMLNGDGTPGDPEAVRNTTVTISDDTPPAEAAGAPDWNERETDRDPHKGRVNRQVASDWHEPIRGNNAVAEHASTDFFHDINAQVASAGRAPALETSDDVFGHGSVAWAYGIEPVLRDGAAFGSDYFKVNETGSQEGIPQVLSPAPGTDHAFAASVGALAQQNSRDATQASAYNAFYEGIMSGG
jgi:hypothetical protein